MQRRNFRALLEARWARGNFVCVGLDSEVGKIPKSVRSSDREEKVVRFNAEIVNHTYHHVCAFKPNLAFYSALGSAGLQALRRTIEHIHIVAPGVPVILDAKQADIGNTNVGYVEMDFEYLGADAVTVHPYLGREALEPFLKCVDRGVIVLCRTSNPGAGEFQDLHTLTRDPKSKPADMSAEEWLRVLCEDSMQLYERVAFNVAREWDKNGNCSVVVGATYPVEAKRVRVRVGDTPFLIPGIGAQGGDVEATVMAGQDGRGRGMIINSSRGIIFASSGEDFAEVAGEEARRLNDLINQYRQGGNGL